MSETGHLKRFGSKSEPQVDFSKGNLSNPELRLKRLFEKGKLLLTAVCRWRSCTAVLSR